MRKFATTVSNIIGESKECDPSTPIHLIDDYNIYLNNVFFKIELSFDTEDAFH